MKNKKIAIKWCPSSFPRCIDSPASDCSRISKEEPKVSKTRRPFPCTFSYKIHYCSNQPARCDHPIPIVSIVYSPRVWASGLHLSSLFLSHLHSPLMAQVSQLPCDGDGICMLCQAKPSDLETITCKTCVTPWHVGCLSNPPETLASTLQWDCPDCSPPREDAPLPPPGNSPLPTAPSSDLVAAIRAIEADASLTDREKAKKRQELLSGKSQSEKDGHDANKEKRKRGDDVLDLFDERLNCSFCMQLPERPVTVSSLLHRSLSSLTCQTTCSFLLALALLARLFNRVFSCLCHLTNDISSSISSVFIFDSLVLTKSYFDCNL